MAIYGRRVTGPDSGSGTQTNQVRASVFGAMPSHGWGYRYHARLGKAGATNVPARGHVWHTDASNNPAGLLGSTNQFTLTQQMNSGFDEADVSVNLAKPVMMHSGERYAVGPATISALARHGMIPAASLPSGANRLMYFRGTSSTGPLNPMGYTSSSTEGHISNAIEYDPNLPPSVPQPMGPSGTITEADPDFLAVFFDPNQLLGGVVENREEKMQQYRIQLRRVGETSLLWNTTYSASPSEQDRNLVDRSFAGTIAPGVNHEWRVQVSDQFGAWSIYSDWTQFTIASGASLSNPRGVSAKINTVTPSGFAVDYQHVDSINANQVQVQILQGGTAVRSSQNVTVNWTPGARTFSPSWSTWQPLDWGVADYAWRMRARDTEGLYSDWTDPVAFNTNARPGTPIALSPTGGAASTSRPTLSFRMSDPDDTPAGNLTAEARIKDETGDTLRVLNVPSAGGDLWELPLTSASLPDYGIYRWDSRGYDGVLEGAWSAEATFIYAEGPDITVTQPAPDAVLETAALSVAWDVTDQARRNIIVYRAGKNTVAYERGWETSTSQSIAISGGDASEWMRNFTDYELVVEVENSLTIRGESLRVPFRVEYPPAPMVTNVQASPELVQGDRAPSTIRTTWGQSGLSTDEFAGYTLVRLPRIEYGQIVALDLDPGAEDAALLDAAMHLTDISSMSQTDYVDPFPANGVEYVYLVMQHASVGTETVSSRPAIAIAESIELTSVVIADRDNGLSSRAVLDFMSSAQIEPVRDDALLDTWDDTGVPAVATSPTAYDVLSDSFRVIDRDGVSAIAQIQMLESLRDARPDGSPVIVVYRDDTGLWVEGRITGFRYSRGRMGRYNVDIEITGARA